MRTNARLERKENELKTQQCQIDRIIELSREEYLEFSRNMLSDYEFIWDNKDEMYIDKEGISHCLLVLGIDITDGILIESEGASYCRYAGILPNANLFVDTHIKKVADFVVQEGMNKAENGISSVDFDEIYKYFHTTITPNNGIGERLFKEIQGRGEVAECIANEDSFEMTYHLENCKEYQPNTINEPMTLLSLMKCNLEDIHLIHVDEEHDLATIVELGENTLTDQGKSDWYDVLSAKIERIYTGFYGLQIDVSGCSPERLQNFSFMLAGQCSEYDFIMWVNQTEMDEGFDMSME